MKFFKNNKGAVTVFVTLLLIPAILISGTGVDLARIHTARSVVQDANQLAANSLLTQYNALLEDLYGLYAIAEDDPVLGEMINEYVKISIFGETSTGVVSETFKLFDGSDLQPVEVTPATDKNLANPDVLRRQIEEYAKFRAPVVIVEEILERVDKFKKVKADSDVIKKKMEIDDTIEDIEEIYKKIYNSINEINGYEKEESGKIGIINADFTKLNTQLKDLREIADDWNEWKNLEEEDQDADVGKDILAHYAAVTKNINSIVGGGDVGETWVEGHWNDDGEYVDGEWETTTLKSGLEYDIQIGIAKLDEYPIKIQGLPLISLVELCVAADLKKAELQKKLGELKAKIAEGKCSQDLADGLTQPDKNGKSVIENYEELFNHEVGVLGNAMKDKDIPEIKGTIEKLKNIQAYMDVKDEDPWISFTNLKNLSSYYQFLNTEDKTDYNFLASLANVTNYEYSESDFVKFEDLSDKHKEFYEVLKNLYSSADGSEGKKDEATDAVNDLLKQAQGKFKEIADVATLSPHGARYYKSAGGDTAGTGFGQEGDWSDNEQASEKTQDALETNFLDDIGNIFDSAGNKILLLSYSTEMFSNFTTPCSGGGPFCDGSCTEEAEKTMAGIPLSTDVNYFFQSELEYLYNGNKESARSNIAAVTGLIFLTRFVFNYISTFIIPEIGTELTTLSAPAGPFAVLVRELLRLGYALAESAIDMTALLSGKAVPLLKMEITKWTISLSAGAGKVLKKAGEVTLDNITGVEDKENGLYYKDYLRIFLLFKDDSLLASRVSDLISFNVTNKRDNINADAEAMGTAELFAMDKAFTDFSIKTTVDMRMLFLSMPFAQEGINGVVPPDKWTLTVTDYRGY